MPLLSPRTVFAPDREPPKAEVIQLLEAIRDGGVFVVAKDTRAELLAVVPVVESGLSPLGYVLNDATTGFNGIYEWTGATWDRARGFPDTIAALTAVAGTANAVTAASRPGVDPAEIVAMVIQPTLSNTGPVTLSIDGAASKPVVSRDGAPLAAGEWYAGRLIMLVDNGDEYRLLDQPDVQALLQTAIDLVNDAQQLGTPGDGTVTTPKLADGAVTPEKLDPARTGDFRDLLVPQGEIDTDPPGGAGTITVLASGQSNAIGRDTSGYFIIDPRVTVWNNANDLDDLTNLGTAFTAVNFAANPFVGGCNNMMVHACSRLAKLTRRNVRLILVAKGATTSEGWVNGGADGPMLTRIKAVLAAAGVSAVDMFLWHQGEGDNSPIPAANYASQMNAMLASLQTAGYVTADTPFIMGQIGPANGTYINPALQAYADSSPRVGLAMIRDLEIADPLTDNAHFTGESLCRAGLEYIKALSATETAWQNVAGVADFTERDVLTTDGETTAAVPYKVAVPPQRFMVARGTRRQSLSNIDMPQNSSTLIPLTVVAGNPNLVQPVGYFAPDRPGIWKVTVQSRLIGWGGSQVLSLVDVDGIARVIAQKSTSGDTAISETLTGIDIRAYGPNDLAYLYCEHSKVGGIILTSDQAYEAFLLHAEYLGA